MDFIQFNLAEGAFWFFCSITSLVAARIRVMPHRFWKTLAALFLLFGISDLVEATYASSFLEATGYWLLVWKALCIIGFLYCLAWYIRTRLKAR